MIAQFALRLVCGMSLMWCLMPRAQVTSGFFRIQMLVALGLSVLAALTSGELVASGEWRVGSGEWRVESGEKQEKSAIRNPQSAIGSVTCGVLAVLSFLGSVMWTLERRKAGSAIAFLIAAGATLLLLSNTLLPIKAHGWQPVGTSSQHAPVVLALLSELSAATLLGAAVTGMLLGHWYLTAPTMSIAPLGRLTLFYGLAGAVRLVLSAIALVLAWSELTSSTHTIWLGLRWLAGIVGPLVVFAMAWRILKYRNTQAATGVLFVGVILTFIGEMTAALLYSELGVPL